jgi:ribosomal protection tetracycline resistance protein
MRTLNLGIVAHVDAGKTTLTERLLWAAGVIDEIGSVDDGTTQTDSLELERQRGITIKSAVVSFVVDDVTVNLIDTPGHPDFIAEVERVLSVLDGAVLVISAVEGVQSQTRVLMRTLQRLRIPTVIFVNKIDRIGAQDEQLLHGLAERLTPAIIPMGSVCDVGTRNAEFRPFGPADVAFTERLADLVSDYDDGVLAEYLDDETSVSQDELLGLLAVQAKRALVHPVVFGSAITGAGVDVLMAVINELLPASEGDASGTVSGIVFKIERGRTGEKIAYVRMFSGTLRTRDRVHVRQDDGQKVTAINVFGQGSTARREAVSAGQIGKLWGLTDIRVGDAIGAARSTWEGHQFAPPTLEAVIVPDRRGDQGALHVALVQLAEQDPLINLRQDDIRRELFVSLYGEVQKQVIQETLATDYGIDVTFRETTTICIERPIGTGAAAEILRDTANPFLATVGLRVEPAAINDGVRFLLAGAVLGTMPLAFFNAVEDTVRETLSQGIYGWEVTDCTITMTHSGYAPRQSHAHQRFNKSMSSTGADFRGLTPLVLMSALKQAGTTVYEPMHRFHLEIPTDTLGSILPFLRHLNGVPHTPRTLRSRYVLEGEIPAARIHVLQQQLSALTRGEGVLESTFDSYQPLRGAIPTRPRADHNPLNRKEYLLNVRKRG